MLGCFFFFRHLLQLYVMVDDLRAQLGCCEALISATISPASADALSPPLTTARRPRSAGFGSLARAPCAVARAPLLADGHNATVLTPHVDRLAATSDKRQQGALSRLRIR